MQREDSLCALLLDDGRLLIREVFRAAGWRLLEAEGRKEGIESLNQNCVHVVITRSQSPGLEWKRVLQDLRRQQEPPQLIVTSRSADEHLWSEVLNCGGYDVLPEPFRRDEIERVVAAARRHYGPQYSHASGGPVRHPSVA